MRLLLPVALAGVLAAGIASAQDRPIPPIPGAKKVPAYMTCAPAQVLGDWLEEHYGEKITHHGFGSVRTLTEIWVGEDGSFTIVSNRANQRRCLLSSGTDFTKIGEPSPAKRGEPI